MISHIGNSPNIPPVQCTMWRTVTVLELIWIVEIGVHIGDVRLAHCRIPLEHLQLLVCERPRVIVVEPYGTDLNSVVTNESAAIFASSTSIDDALRLPVMWQVWSCPRRIATSILLRCRAVCIVDDCSLPCVEADSVIHRRWVIPEISNDSRVCTDVSVLSVITVRTRTEACCANVMATIV